MASPRKGLHGAAEIAAFRQGEGLPQVRIKVGCNLFERLKLIQPLVGPGFLQVGKRLDHPCNFLLSRFEVNHLECCLDPQLSKPVELHYGVEFCHLRIGGMPAIMVFLTVGKGGSGIYRQGYREVGGTKCHSFPMHDSQTLNLSFDMFSDLQR